LFWFLILQGPSWSWSCGSWIYNYLWNQCLLPLTLRVRIPIRRGVLDTLCDKVCQWLAAGRWFSSVSSTNKTVRPDITEILLSVALNTITLTSLIYKYDAHYRYPSRTPGFTPDFCWDRCCSSSLFSLLSCLFLFCLSSFCVLCTQCCQFLWIFLSLLPLCFSLKFIYLKILDVINKTFDFSLFGTWVHLQILVGFMLLDL